MAGVCFGGHLPVPGDPADQTLLPPANIYRRRPSPLPAAMAAPPAGGFRHLLAVVGTVYSRQLFLPWSVRRPGFLSFVPAFSGRDDMDSGYRLFTAGSGRAGGCALFFKTHHPGAAKAKRDMAEKSGEGKPLLPGSGTKFNHAGRKAGAHDA